MKKYYTKNVKKEELPLRQWYRVEYYTTIKPPTGIDVNDVNRFYPRGKGEICNIRIWKVNLCSYCKKEIIVNEWHGCVTYGKL